MTHFKTANVLQLTTYLVEVILVWHYKWQYKQYNSESDFLCAPYLTVHNDHIYDVHDSRQQVQKIQKKYGFGGIQSTRSSHWLLESLPILKWNQIAQIQLQYKTRKHHLKSMWG